MQLKFGTGNLADLNHLQSKNKILHVITPLHTMDSRVNVQMSVHVFSFLFCTMLVRTRSIIEIHV
jgi:hypothetical protein